MFTLKYEGSNGAEFLVTAGSISASRDDLADGRSLIQIVARETDSDTSHIVGIWGGRYLPTRTVTLEDDEAWGCIYVMNSAGATVATYRYAFPQDTLIEPEPPIAKEDLPHDMQVAA